jgi:hypothetical protein
MLVGGILFGGGGHCDLITVSEMLSFPSPVKGIMGEEKESLRDSNQVVKKD